MTQRIIAAGSNRLKRCCRLLSTTTGSALASGGAFGASNWLQLPSAIGIKLPHHDIAINTGDVAHKVERERTVTSDIHWRLRRRGRFFGRIAHLHRGVGFGFLIAAWQQTGRIELHPHSHIAANFQRIEPGDFQPVVLGLRVLIRQESNLEFPTAAHVLPMRNRTGRGVEQLCSSADQVSTRSSPDPDRAYRYG